MEGDAGTGQLNPTQETSETATDAESAAVFEDESGEPAGTRRQERFGRGWFIGIVSGLIVVALAIGVGGYLTMRGQSADRASARNDAVALERAKECVAATQAPDIAAMTASQSKIIECSTGDFAAQATLYSSVLVEAYQAADVAVQVSELRAAVERRNDDQSIDVLVAVRVKVTNSAVANQDQGYRLRVTMMPADGTYKIARLDQVTS